MPIAWRYAATASSSLPWPLQRIAEVGMSLGEVRLDADRLAICSDRLVELALVLQRMPRLEWASA